MNKQIADISEKILQIQQSIFANEYENLTSQVSQLIENILQQGDVFSVIQIQQLNTILLEILNSIEQEDYLLTADILEYKLYEFIKCCLLEASE